MREDGDIHVECSENDELYSANTFFTFLVYTNTVCGSELVAVLKLRPNDFIKCVRKALVSIGVNGVPVNRCVCEDGSIDFPKTFCQSTGIDDDSLKNKENIKAYFLENSFGSRLSPFDFNAPFLFCRGGGTRILPLEREESVRVCDFIPCVPKKDRDLLPPQWRFSPVPKRVKVKRPVQDSKKRKIAGKNLVNSYNNNNNNIKQMCIKDAYAVLHVIQGMVLNRLPAGAISNPAAVVNATPMFRCERVFVERSLMSGTPQGQLVTPTHLSRLITRWNLNTSDCFGRTILHECCATGNTAAVAYLLSTIDIIDGGSELKDKAETPVRPATLCVDAPDALGNTPLHLATRMGYVECVAQLLECNTKGSRGRRYVTTHPHFFEIVKGLQLSENRTKKFEAVTETLYRLASLLPVNPLRPNFAGVTPLHLALERRDALLIKRFFTVIELAGLHNFDFDVLRYLDCVNLRLWYGAQLRAPTRFLSSCGTLISTPLFRSFVHAFPTPYELAVAGQLSALQVAMNHPLCTSYLGKVVFYGIAGDSLLHAAARGGHVEVLDFLLQDPQLKILSKAAAAGDRVASPWLDDSGNNPMHHAARAGKISTLQLLLSRGYKLDSKNRLHSSCLNEKNTSVELLPISVNDKNVSYRTVLHEAAHYGRVECMCLLINFFIVDPLRLQTCTADRHGVTPLHLAAAHGWDNVVLSLVKVYNTTPNIRSYRSQILRNTLFSMLKRPLLNKFSSLEEGVSESSGTVSVRVKCASSALCCTTIYSSCPLWCAIQERKTSTAMLLFSLQSDAKDVYISAPEPFGSEQFSPRVPEKLRQRDPIALSLTKLNRESGDHPEVHFTLKQLYLYLRSMLILALERSMFSVAEKLAELLNPTGQIRESSESNVKFTSYVRKDPELLFRFTMSGIKRNDIVRWLLNHGFGCESHTETTGYTPLACACYAGDSDLVCAFLDETRAVSKKHAFRQTEESAINNLLYLAISGPHKGSCAREMIITQLVQNGVPAGFYSAESANKIVRALKHGFATSDGLLPLVQAALRGELSIVRLLCQKGRITANDAAVALWWLLVAVPPEICDDVRATSAYIQKFLAEIDKNCNAFALSRKVSSVSRRCSLAIRKSGKMCCMVQLFDSVALELIERFVDLSDCPFHPIEILNLAASRLPLFQKFTLSFSQRILAMPDDILKLLLDEAGVVHAPSQVQTEKSKSEIKKNLGKSFLTPKALFDSLISESFMVHQARFGKDAVIAVVGFSADIPRARGNICVTRSHAPRDVVSAFFDTVCGGRLILPSFVQSSHIGSCADLSVRNSHSGALKWCFALGVLPSQNGRCSTMRTLTAAAFAARWWLRSQGVNYDDATRDSIAQGSCGVWNVRNRATLAILLALIRIGEFETMKEVLSHALTARALQNLSYEHIQDHARGECVGDGDPGSVIHWTSALLLAGIEAEYGNGIKNAFTRTIDILVKDFTATAPLEYVSLLFDSKKHHDKQSVNFQIFANAVAVGVESVLLARLVRQLLVPFSAPSLLLPCAEAVVRAKLGRFSLIRSPLTAFTPLYLASMQHRLDIIELLFNFIAEQNTQNPADAFKYVFEISAAVEKGVYSEPTICSDALTAALLVPALVSQQRCDLTSDDDLYFGMNEVLPPPPPNDSCYYVVQFLITKTQWPYLNPSLLRLATSICNNKKHTGEACDDIVLFLLRSYPVRALLYKDIKLGNLQQVKKVNTSEECKEKSSEEDLIRTNELSLPMFDLKNFKFCFGTPGVFTLAKGAARHVRACNRALINDTIKRYRDRDSAAKEIFFSQLPLLFPIKWIKAISESKTEDLDVNLCTNTFSVALSSGSVDAAVHLLVMLVFSNLITDLSTENISKLQMWAFFHKKKTRQYRVLLAQTCSIATEVIKIFKRFPCVDFGDRVGLLLRYTISRGLNLLYAKMTREVEFLSNCLIEVGCCNLLDSALDIIKVPVNPQATLLYSSINSDQYRMMWSLSAVLVSAALAIDNKINYEQDCKLLLKGKNEQFVINIKELLETTADDWYELTFSTNNESYVSFFPAELKTRLRDVMSHFFDGARPVVLTPLALAACVGNENLVLSLLNNHAAYAREACSSVAYISNYSERENKNYDFKKVTYTTVVQNVPAINFALANALYFVEGLSLLSPISGQTAATERASSARTFEKWKGALEGTRKGISIIKIILARLRPSKDIVSIVAIAVAALAGKLNNVGRRTSANVGSDVPDAFLPVFESIRTLRRELLDVFKSWALSLHRPEGFPAVAEIPFNNDLSHVKIPNGYQALLVRTCHLFSARHFGHVFFRDPFLIEEDINLYLSLCGAESLYKCFDTLYRNPLFFVARARQARGSTARTVLEIFIDSGVIRGDSMRVDNKRLLTPLMVVLMCRVPPCISVLSKLSGEVSDPEAAWRLSDYKGQTALLIAAIWGHLEYLQFMMKKGKNVLLHTNIYGTNNVLLAAAFHNHTELLVLILQNTPRSVLEQLVVTTNPESPHLWTSLIHCAAQGGCTLLFQYLEELAKVSVRDFVTLVLSKQSDSNKMTVASACTLAFSRTDRTGFTPLILASLFGHTDTLRQMMHLLFSVDVLEKKGNFASNLPPPDTALLRGKPFVVVQKRLGILPAAIVGNVTELSEAPETLTEISRQLKKAQSRGDKHLVQELKARLEEREALCRFGSFPPGWFHALMTLNQQVHVLQQITLKSNVASTRFSGAQNTTETFLPQLLKGTLQRENKMSEKEDSDHTCGTIEYSLSLMSNPLFWCVHNNCVTGLRVCAEIGLCESQTLCSALLHVSARRRALPVMQILLGFQMCSVYATDKNKLFAIDHAIAACTDESELARNSIAVKCVLYLLEKMASSKALMSLQRPDGSFFIDSIFHLIASTRCIGLVSQVADIIKNVLITFMAASEVSAAETVLGLMMNRTASWSLCIPSPTRFLRGTEFFSGQEASVEGAQVKVSSTENDNKVSTSCVEKLTPIEIAIQVGSPSFALQFFEAAERLQKLAHPAFSTSATMLNQEFMHYCPYLGLSKDFLRTLSFINPGFQTILFDFFSVDTEFLPIISCPRGSFGLSFADVHLIGILRFPEEYYKLPQLLDSSKYDMEYSIMLKIEKHVKSSRLTTKGEEKSEPEISINENALQALLPSERVRVTRILHTNVLAGAFIDLCPKKIKKVVFEPTVKKDLTTPDLVTPPMLSADGVTLIVPFILFKNHISYGDPLSALILCRTEKLRKRRIQINERLADLEKELKESKVGGTAVNFTLSTNFETSDSPPEVRRIVKSLLFNKIQEDFGVHKSLAIKIFEELESSLTVLDDLIKYNGKTMIYTLQDSLTDIHLALKLSSTNVVFFDKSPSFCIVFSFQSLLGLGGNGSANSLCKSPAITLKTHLTPRDIVGASNVGTCRLITVPFCVAGPGSVSAIPNSNPVELVYHHADPLVEGYFAPALAELSYAALNNKSFCQAVAKRMLSCMAVDFNLRVPQSHEKHSNVVDALGGFSLNSTNFYMNSVGINIILEERSANAYYCLRPRTVFQVLKEFFESLRDQIKLACICVKDYFCVCTTMPHQYPPLLLEEAIASSLLELSLVVIKFVPDSLLPPRRVQRIIRSDGSKGYICELYLSPLYPTLLLSDMRSSLRENALLELVNSLAPLVHETVNEVQNELFPVLRVPVSLDKYGRLLAGSFSLGNECAEEELESFLAFALAILDGESRPLQELTEALKGCAFSEIARIIRHRISVIVVRPAKPNCTWSCSYCASRKELVFEIGIASTKPVGPPPSRQDLFSAIVVALEPHDARVACVLSLHVPFPQRCVLAYSARKWAYTLNIQVKRNKVCTLILLQRNVLDETLTLAYAVKEEKNAAAQRVRESTDLVLAEGDRWPEASRCRALQKEIERRRCSSNINFFDSNDVVLYATNINGELVQLHRLRTREKWKTATIGRNELKALKLYFCFNAPKEKGSYLIWPEMKGVRSSTPLTIVVQ